MTTQKLTPPCTYLPGIPDVPQCQLLPGTCIAACDPNAAACAPTFIPCPPEAVPIDGAGALFGLIVVVALAAVIALMLRATHAADQRDRARRQRGHAPTPRYPQD